MKNMKIKSLITTAAVALLALPAPASAHKHHHRTHHHRAVHHVVAPAPRPNPTTAALALAYRYWHTVPCNGQINVVTTTPPSNDAKNPYNEATSMWSTWDDGTANENNESAPQPFTGCTIGINSNVWTSEGWEAYGAWPEFSIDMIHEVGHMLGLPDIFAEDGNIMDLSPSSDVAFTGETLWPEE